MKRLTWVWWESDPKTLLTMYKAIVRSYLDFAMTCIIKTSKTSWNKLNNVQYQALRTALGCMKFTPIGALLAEAGETPLDIRRIWLAAKTCVKLLAGTDDKTTNQVIDTHTLLLENRQYGRKYDCSAMTEGMDQALHYNNQIYKDDRPFQACGMGICSEDQDLQIYRKPTDYTAIRTAETLAIREVVKIMGKRTDKLAVITDSLSALQAITKQGIDKDQDYITLSTREEITSVEHDCNIKLIWVPSHTTAQKGREQIRVHQNIAIPGSSFLGMNKDKLWNQWTTRYKNWEQNKGQHYADVQPFPPRTP
nr:unnamed protein product [Callosobruchus analis]